MAYCTAAEVKAYIGTVKTTDDTLIAALIVRAESMINGYCKRTFTQREDETRVFDAVKDVAGRILFLDDDLLSIDSITNGDGAELTASQYTLLPNNRSPKYAIKLKASASTTWTYTNDPEAAISVVGTWGYVASDTPPADINHAAVRLTAWYYHQKSAPFETTGMPELGIVTVPSAIPEDIKGILDMYTRQTIGVT
jgi:hypothetical protein